MEIKTSSWHYRLLYASPIGTWGMPSTVCSYVTSLGIILTILAFCVAGLFLTPLMLYEPYMVVVRELGGMIKAVIFLASLAGMAVWLLIGFSALFGVIYCIGGSIVWLIKKWNLIRHGNVAGPPPRAPSEPGLIKTWYRGVRDKHCTVINYRKE